MIEWLETATSQPAYFPKGYFIHRHSTISNFFEAQKNR